MKKKIFLSENKKPLETKSGLLVTLLSIALATITLILADKCTKNYPKTMRENSGIKYYQKQTKD